MRRILVGASLASLATVLAACAHDTSHPACADISAPGVVVQFNGLDVFIRDAAGRGAALGATVVVRPLSAPTDSAVVVGNDSLHVLAGFLRPSTLSVTIRKPFYRDTVVQPVPVVVGECGGVSVAAVLATLRLAPGAPPVRSAGVVGTTTFLVLPTDRVQLAAVVDADPGLLTAVTWRSSDTTLATVDANGLVAARCTTLGGTDTVTVVSVADTTVRGKHAVVVTKQTSCP